MRITKAHIDALDKMGYVLIPDFLGPEELAQCQGEVAAYFPACSELLDQSHIPLKADRLARFPFVGEALNQVTMHPDIIDFLERVYGTGEIRLGESTLQVKYGCRIGPSADQLLHNDTWGKKSLTYPRDDGIFRQIFMILYYSNVSDDLGPTYILSQEHTRDMLLVTPSGTTGYVRDEYPGLYEHEKPVLARAGTLLIFTGKTMHRGSAVRAEIGERHAHFITYHASAATWMETLGWPSGSRPYPDSPDMRSFIENATPRQRELIGFPGVGSAYWNEETLRGVAARYPSMDMSPYLQATNG
jgi:hypothetical protein